MFRLNLTRRDSRTNKPLEFLKLECRNLLAQVAVDLPAPNLIVNGDFETFVNQDDTNFYDVANVPGWNAMDGDGNEIQINLHTHDNENGTILDLDSTPLVFDTVFQDVNTVLEQQYILAFDFRDQPLVSGDQDPLTNDFEVFWNGQLLGPFTGGDQIQTAAFRVFGGSLEQGDSTDLTKTRLEFRDMRGNGDRTGDGRGALIDHVRLVEATISEITNGSFEDSNPDKTRFFQPVDVDGWAAMGDDFGKRLLQIETSDSFIPNATAGDQYLNLDTTDDQLDRIYQFVDTTPGETYYVTFDMRVDGPQDVNRDDLRVRWNDQWAATFRSGTTEFQNFGLIVQAESDSTLLVFREPGEDLGDGSGPLIDNVRIFQIDRVVNDLQVDIDPASDGLNGNADFVQESGPANIAPAVELMHESGRTLSYAAVTILNLANPGTERLAVVVGSTSITTSFNPAAGLLELRGTASIEDYQTVLRSLTYDNTALNPTLGIRQVAISITDANILSGDNFSPRSLIQLDVSAENIAPQIASIADRAVDFGDSLNFNIDATDADNDDLQYSISHSEISPGHNTPTIDGDGNVVWTPSESGDVKLTVRATDPSGEFAEQTFTVSVGEFQPFAGNGALSDIPPELRNGIYNSQPPNNIDTTKSYQAVFNTTAGEMTFELLDDTAEITVNNFINLVNDGFYDGVIFHRVLQGFAQGGDPDGSGTGGPGYQFIDENPGSSFAAGALAMANAGPNTNGSQFFITTDSQNFVTRHTTFGQIVNGQSVFDQLSITHVRVNGQEVPTGNPPTIINSISINEL